MPAQNASRFNTAATHVVVAADNANTDTRLRRIVLHSILVGTGATSGSVSVQYDDGEIIAVLDAANPSIGQRFDLEIAGRGLQVVLTGTPDVTVFWS